MRISRQVRLRRPKYVVAQLIEVEVPLASDNEPEERHDSWVDSATERFHGPAPHEEWYEEARMPTVSRQRIGFHRNEERSTWT